jgi:chaperonin GroES
MEAEEKTSSGIIIPDTAKEKPMKGEIIAVGQGKVTDDGKTVPMEVKVGDKVLYGKYSGTEITVDNTEYLIMRESDVYAII